MRTPEQIAWDIHLGKDLAALAELEKMMGKPFERMSIKERRFGIAVLAGTENWSNSWEK